jgi:NUMOD1 domain
MTYYQEHKAEILRQRKIYQKNNKEKIVARKRIHHREHPEIIIYHDIWHRCNNPKNKEFSNYGDRGIQCLITRDEIYKLAIRDNYWGFKKPSIDRIDNDGNYTFENCQFIEFEENKIKDQMKPILQFDLNGNFIKEWASAGQAAKALKGNRQGINNAVLGKSKSSSNSLWKYKNV